MQTKGRTARLFLAGLPDKKERTAGSPRPEIEPAAFRQTEMRRIAPHFEDDGREGSAFHRGLGKPEGFAQLARRRMKKSFRVQPEIPEALEHGAAGSSAPMASPIQSSG
ncbi:hypothetical protein, partial [Rhizobium sp. Pop5]|uniref:hypothetical protein n=1 Tax=Rhizobium sp. Pop5 TaxID=1223565 RepID=UPI001969F9D3